MVQSSFLIISKVSAHLAPGSPVQVVPAHLHFSLEEQSPLLQEKNEQGTHAPKWQVQLGPQSKPFLQVPEQGFTFSQTLELEHAQPNKLPQLVPQDCKEHDSQLPVIGLHPQLGPH